MFHRLLLLLPLALLGCEGPDPVPLCGDGLQTADEQCDDGNDNNTDFCLTSCALATCGDGYLYAAYEQCDEGDNNGDGGGAACTTECRDNYCGDGLVGPGEDCDDGNAIHTDACTNTCEDAECGDGILAATEQCDDDGTDPGDGCNAACEIELNWQCGLAGCECSPGYQGAQCGSCAPGWQDDDADGACEASCDLYEATGACDLSVSSCVLVDGAPTCTCNDGLYDLGQGCQELDPCTVFVSVGGSGDGSTWAQAGGDLQAAIDEAATLAAARLDGRCDVWASQGTYTIYESALTDTLQLASGVRVIGGFEGTEATLDDREVDPITGLSEFESVIDGYDVRHAITGASDAWIEGFAVVGAEALGVGSEEEGQGAGLYAIDANGLTVASMDFRDLQAVTGGAIYVRGGDLTVRSSRFTTNGGRQYGGAISAWQSDGLTIEDSWFEGNSVSNKHGGAVFALGVAVLTVEDTTFFANHAQHDGGGIWFAGGSNVTFVGSRFVDNYVGSSLTSGCIGGAASIGGFDQNDVDFQLATNLSRMHSLSVVDTDFVGNRSNAEGGALYLYGIDNVDFVEATFTENDTGPGGRDAYAGYFGQGGGISALDLGDVSFAWTVFEDNWSGWRGAGLRLDQGGDIDLDHVTFSGNTSTAGDAGGVWLADVGDVVVDEGVFSGNLSRDGGMGLAVKGFTHLDVRGGIFDHNVMYTQLPHGALFARGGNTPAGGVTIDGTVFQENWAGGPAAALGVHMADSLDLRRVRFLGNSSPDAAPAGASVTSNGSLSVDYVRNVVIRDTAFDGNGTSVDAYNGIGGGRVSHFETFDISNTSFTDNIGHMGGLFVCTFVDEGDGTFSDPCPGGLGSLYGVDPSVTYASVVTVDRVRFEDNLGRWGGALRSRGGTDVVIRDSSFSGNTSQTEGAGLSVAQSGSVTVQRTAFAGNVAEVPGGSNQPGEGDAGALHLRYNDDVVLEDVDLIGNEAGYVAGGALILDSETVSLTRVRVDGSSAESTGAGVNVQVADSLAVDACSLVGAASRGVNGPTMGGGLFADQVGQVSLTRSFFKGNSAAPEDVGYQFVGGGAVALYRVDDVLVSDSIFDANVAAPGGLYSQHGGALSVRPALGATPVIEILGSTFVNDDAPRASSVAIDRSIIGDSAFVDVRVRNTIAWDQTGDVPMRHFYGSYFFSDHPDGIAYSFSDIEGQTAGGTVYSEDPLFQDADTTDPSDPAYDAYKQYRLSASSNLKAAGEPITNAVDFEGTPRSATPAIGALEYAAP